MGGTPPAPRATAPPAEQRAQRPPAAQRKPIRVYPEQFALPETDEGTVLFNVPFPEDLKDLKKMAPIIIRQPYHIDYIHSYGQDSPFFAGLANRRLLGTVCTTCGYKYATPKRHCMECGGECDWFELPQEGQVHTFTVCHFGSEEFLKETPFILALIQFEGVNTLFLTRLVGLDPADASLDWVGMKVRARFRRLSKFKPTDVYFVPAEGVPAR
ncbi:MAG: Zn-ribbon domain-containing OB-fold protein [Candidatus Methylomirabilales bacterium]